MSRIVSPSILVRRFSHERLDRRTLANAVTVPGAALLEGWSDDEPWTILLPWPAEVRTLSWDELSGWRQMMSTLETGGVVSDPFPAAPFLGGWVGFLSYELGAVEKGATPPDPVPPEPPLFFAHHRAGLLCNSEGMWIFGPDETIDDDEKNLRYLLAAPSAPSLTRRPMDFTDSLPGTTYREKVSEIREAIARGDVYQTNLTRCFATGALDAADLYHSMTAPDPPRCSAFIRGDGWSIASASPEVFLELNRQSGIGESRPIKGTVRRSGDDERDVARLFASEKDAAEHLMIVDLVRNDFGKVTPPGRVSVPEYRTIRTLVHVHHLESTVRAEGLAQVPLVELIAALFPGGSITGAPKRAAVGMIRRLEPVPRGVYTGAIGFCDHRGRTSLSVAIRTAIVTTESSRYHAGGGIVWESDPVAEDDESIAKSTAFLQYLKGSPV